MEHDGPLGWVRGPGARTRLPGDCKSRNVQAIIDFFVGGTAINALIVGVDRQLPSLTPDNGGGPSL